MQSDIRSCPVCENESDLTNKVLTLKVYSQGQMSWVCQKCFSVVNDDGVIVRLMLMHKNISPFEYGVA